MSCKEHLDVLLYVYPGIQGPIALTVLAGRIVGLFLSHVVQVGIVFNPGKSNYWGFE